MGDSAASNPCRLVEFSSSAASEELERDHKSSQMVMVLDLLRHLGKTTEQLSPHMSTCPNSTFVAWDAQLS